MPSRFRLRNLFAPMVRLIAKGLIPLHFTPNRATILMLISSFIAAVALLLTGNLVLFGVIVFITGLLDGVDGAIARITRESSPYGGFLDSTLDRASEIFIFAALIWDYQTLFIFPDFVTFGLIWAILVASSLISYTRARTDLILKENEPLKSDPHTPSGKMELQLDSNVGLMGRSERLFGLFLLAIFSAWVGPSFFSWGFVVLTCLIIGTLLFRILDYRTLIKVNFDKNGSR